MLNIGDRVIVNDTAIGRLSDLQPGITGTITRINQYADGSVEYVVYLDYVQIQYIKGCLFVAGKMWDWFNASEVDRFAA